MLIIPDTNFLIYLSKYRLWDDLKKLYGRYRIMILPEIAYELENLVRKSKGKEQKDMLLALEIVNQLKKKITSKKGYADEAILKMVDSLKRINKKNFVIATMDKELRKKAKRQKIKILTIRQKKYLREI